MSQVRKLFLEQIPQQWRGLQAFFTPSESHLRKLIDGHNTPLSYLALMLLLYLISLLQAIFWLVDNATSSWQILIVATFYPLLLLFFYLLAVVVVAAPLQSAMMRLSLSDEIELYRWTFERDKIRKLAITLFTFGNWLLTILTGLSGPSIAMLLMMLWFTFISISVLKAQWNFLGGNAMAITLAPMLVYGFAISIISLSIWLVAIATFLLTIGGYFSLGDLWKRRNLRKQYEGVKVQSENKLSHLLEIYYSAIALGDKELLMKMASSASSLPDWFYIRLLSGAGRPLEALDLGVANLESGEDALELHLAISEACLLVYDMENAAAHAEEALDQAVSASTEEGTEALLLLAIACYADGEIISGENALKRLLILPKKKVSSRQLRMLSQANMLSHMAAQLNY